MVPMAEVVKNCVREKRTEKGVTQEDVAVAIGVSRQTVIAIEKGNYVFGAKWFSV